VSPRTYQMGQRQAATDKTKERILNAARKLLLGEDFSTFTMEAVARAADVSRLTVYYQFDSKAGLLEALYNHIARRGEMARLADVFRHGADPLKMLQDFILVFARFWASDRDVIRRLHALGAIDAEIVQSLRARNETIELQLAQLQEQMRDLRLGRGGNAPGGGPVVPVPIESWQRSITRRA